MARSKPLRRKRKKSSAPVPVGFGNQVEWKAFLTVNPARTRAIQNILETCKQVFLRTLISDKPSDRVGFYLGRICVEEFNEILLLSGNGYGVGALKILRGMYERAVTAAYLLDNPEFGELFLDYHKVHKHKAYNHGQKMGPFKPQFSEETVKQIKEEFEAVKAQYTEEICSVCKKTRIQGSWTKLDTLSLAKKAGKGFEELYFDAFYLPTLQVHTTVSSLMNRLGQTPEGRMTFNPGAQRTEARHATVLAHNLLLSVIESQNRHFSLGLESLLEKNVADFQEAYGQGQKDSV